MNLPKNQPGVLILCQSVKFLDTPLRTSNILRKGKWFVFGTWF